MKRKVGNVVVTSEEAVRYAGGDEFRAFYWERVLGPAFREGSRRLCEDIDRALLEEAARKLRLDDAGSTRA